MKRVIPMLLVSALLAGPAIARPQDEEAREHRLVLVGVGRFAVLADMVSVERDGDGVRMRAFQVAEEDFHVGDQAYWGGWSWWRFDCAARTADRLDFAAVKAGGQEGPATPDPAPPYDAAPGGDAAELLAAACDPSSVGPYGVSVLSEAVWIGRTALAE